MQMSVVKVAGVPFVAHRGMAAVRAVRMSMPFVLGASSCGNKGRN